MPRAGNQAPPSRVSVARSTLRRVDALRRQSRRWRAIWIIALWGGCGSPHDELLEIVERSAELTGAKSSPSAELRAEVAIVESERAAPAQLARSLPPDAENVAAALAAIFRGSDAQPLFDEASELFQRPQFQFHPVERHQVEKFCRRHRRKLEQLEAAVERPQCNFAIRFRRGHFFDLVFIDEVIAAGRMFGLAAALSLDGGAIDEAVRQSIAMTTLAEHLSRETHLESRIAAASLRADALLVWEAVVQHEKTDFNALSALLQCLNRQLARWPSDSDALVGERALTLHAYEVIRLNRLDLLLTSEERQSLRSEGILRDLLAVAAAHVDSDEQYYLTTMRKYIELCRLPYYQRLEDYAQLTRSAGEDNGVRDYPILATRLFLPDLIPSLRIMAKDRARCEAWRLALLSVLRGAPPEPVINPHSGEVMQVSVGPDRVIVRLGEEGERNPLIPLPRQRVGDQRVGGSLPR